MIWVKLRFAIENVAVRAAVLVHMTCDEIGCNLTNISNRS